MKYVRMAQLLVLAVCSLGLSLVQAQDDYIVTLQNDTLRGTVKMMLYSAESKVQLATEGKKKATYSILQVKGLKHDGNIYHTIRTPRTYVFMRLLTSGYMSLYAAQPEGQNTWDARFLVKRDGSILEVPNLGFKKRMTDFLSECPQIANAIDNGEYGRNDLEDVIAKFNACIESGAAVATTDIATTPPPVDSNKLNTWNDLEAGIRKELSATAQADALEILNEIKNKVKRSEKIPNFMLEGLREQLKNNEALLALFDKAKEATQ